MRNIFFVIAGVLLFMTSCGTEGVEHSKIEENVYDIELLNNEKWIVVEEMMAHIQNMNNEVNDFKSEDSYSELGLSLQGHINLLTSNCTMKGQGHDELHKWLLPYIDLVDDLNNASSLEAKRQSYTAIKDSFIEFNKYFE